MIVRAAQLSGDTVHNIVMVAVDDNGNPIIPEALGSFEFVVLEDDSQVTKDWIRGEDGNFSAPEVEYSDAFDNATQDTESAEIKLEGGPLESPGTYIEIDGAPAEDDNTKY